MTGVISGEHEPRAQFDAVFGAVGSASEQVGWIESVEIDADLAVGTAAPGGLDPLSLTLTIPQEEEPHG
ncbi:hypothetical protein D3C72_718170 [compost metagenome]